jgi:hypothetical protein
MYEFRIRDFNDLSKPAFISGTVGGMTWDVDTSTTVAVELMVFESADA